MAKQNQEKSMRRSFLNSFIFPGILLAITVVFTILFSVLYISTEDKLFLILLMSVSVALFIVFIISSVISIRYLYDLYYKGLFEVTKNNMNAIYNNNNDFKRYPVHQHIHEMNVLNEEVDKVTLELKNATLVPINPDYTSLNFEYVPGFERVITGSSLKANLDNLIFLSNTYRNVLFELYYEIGDEEIKDEEISTVITILNQHLKDYEGKLIALDESKKSIFVYIPRIDTFSRLREELIATIQNTSVVKDSTEGYQTYNAKIVLVAYPYSDTDELIHDLTYAKQAGNIINFYLPNRMIGSNEVSLMKDSINLNVVSKIVESLGELKVNEYEQNYEDIIRNSIRSLATYLNCDDAGYIRMDDNTFDYISRINISKTSHSLLGEGNIIDKNFISTMAMDKDIDKSYYFSTRSHANNTLGRHFDRYRFNAGFYYVVEDDNGETIGIIYFFNRNRDLILNSYLREGLVLFSSRIGEFIVGHKRSETSRNAFEAVDSILLLANYGTYRIDKETYEIISFSDNLRTYFPEIAKQKVCYRTLYGFDRPCQNCPITSSTKLVQKYKEYLFETSLNLDKDNTSRYVNMFVKHTREDGSTEDRFNKDYLVNSYYALAEDVNNCYTAKSKGYLLLLRIDNLDECVTKYGSEATMVAIRTFLNNIKRKFGGVQNVYCFNSQTFGVLCQEYGQIDVVNKCEIIYDLSKQKYFDDDDNVSQIKITYLPMVYPSSYPTAGDFLKNAQKFFDSGKYDTNKDHIYFEENGYDRPANKETFMLSVIDDKFGNSTFTALLQPYLTAKERKVYGVEMLLRLTDDYRNLVFNADELVKVASRNGKMKVISDALINFAGNLYMKQGSSMFKTFGLKRFSINIDYSYFKDPGAIDNLVGLTKSFNFPKDFLAFEVPEWDIKDHFAEYKEIAETLKKHGITLVCDQFSERHISVEKLQNIGVNEIKIGRGIGGFIDSDPQKQETISSIMKRAKALGMQTSVVGLENNAQYEIVRDLDDKAFVQGYYFYKPLDKNALINALRNNAVNI